MIMSDACAFHLCPINGEILKRRPKISSDCSA